MARSVLGDTDRFADAALRERRAAAGIAVVLLVGHHAAAGPLPLTGTWQLVAGAAAGLAIGAVASLLGVAGGELLIPTLVLLFGADIKLASSLSLTVSLPTMLVGFARYSGDRSFTVVARNRALLLSMAASSILGAFLGGLLLGVVPGNVLLPALAILLLISAVKVWQHTDRRGGSAGSREPTFPTPGR